jgi:hypothetical protein
MNKNLALNLAPGGQAYMWAARVSRFFGIVAAFFLFSLISHWYIGLPIALTGFWITEGLCGILWIEVREILSCDDTHHRALSAIRLAVEIPIGAIAFYFVPNWRDFEFNGHPSLVAVAGSLLLGIVSFVVAAGLVAFVGIRLSNAALRFWGHDVHN